MAVHMHNKLKSIVGIALQTTSTSDGFGVIGSFHVNPCQAHIPRLNKDKWIWPPPAVEMDVTSHSISANKFKDVSRAIIIGIPAVLLQ